MLLIPIPAFADSCPGLMHNAKRALVVDPGEEKPVFRAVEQRGRQPSSILVKRPPARHTRGDAALRKPGVVRVYAPSGSAHCSPL